MPETNNVDEKVFKIHEKILSSKSIAIIAHQNPDGDAICSSLALRNIIRTNCYSNHKGTWRKKLVHIFFDCAKLPESLSFFTKNTEDFVNVEKYLKQYELVICLDSNNPSRLGKYQSVFDNAKYTINIDHHQDNTNFASLNLVAAKSSSTSELIFKIYNSKLKKYFPYEITNYALAQIYAGILTDTNNMQNNADNPSTVKSVSQIISKIGVKQVSKIKQELFQNLSKAKMMLVSFSHDRRLRKYFLDDSICIIVLNSKIFAKAKAELDDAEGIVDSALSMEGVKISVLILEKEKGNFFVKLRGKNIDVSHIAQQFGGGGHKYMAGFNFSGNFNSIKYELLKSCENAIFESEKNGDGNHNIFSNEN